MRDSFYIEFGKRVSRVAAAASLLVALGVTGCSKLEHHHTSKNVVYVVARKLYLRDRVAAVSNLTAQVTNGEQLEVLERTKRFLKVRTPKNEVGWLEERAVIDGPHYDQFAQLNDQHEKDPVIATGILRDDMYLHVKPGRDTDHFFLLTENTHLDLLARGSVAKVSTNGAVPVLAHKAKAADNADDAAAPPPPPMEDWLLVRDHAGHTGWILATRMDVDIPAEVEGYSEGQRIVGAYMLTKVHDDSVPAGDGNVTTKEMPEYVMALAEPKNGLRYDFDQIRVFTWSLNHHRYETAFRMRYIKGYLPVTITHETVPQGMGNISGSSAPVFSFRILNGDAVGVDPDTGITHPASTRTVSFRLDGNLVHRTGADQGPIPTDEPEKVTKKKR